MTRGPHMLLFYGTIALAIGSNVLYHLFQKAIPATINPFVALAATYATALVICLLVLPFYPAELGLAGSLRRLSWASVGLGVAIVGLEMGFLLAYRAGWSLSLAALVSNVAVGLLLLPIGVFLLRERLSPLNLLGIALCIVGIVLMNTRGSGG